MFSGSIPALVTPFSGDGTFDEPAFRAFVDWQIEHGSAALVPCSTTGEAATLSITEHSRVVAVCIDQAGSRVPVIAGCGSNDLAVTLEQVCAAKMLGATAVLVAPPNYNRPNQEGIFRYFEVLAQDGGVPIILYNVPSRTVTDINFETMGRIVAAFPEVVIGLKDATGAIARVSAQRRACGLDFCQLSGSDDSALAHYAMGGRGCISVTANVAPNLCAKFQAACATRDYAAARAYQDRLYPLHSAVFSVPPLEETPRLQSGRGFSRRLG
jgi:4-hydroxy-tetrahydrodipicolinate synthase